jgi:hypothetical protein
MTGDHDLGGHQGPVVLSMVLYEFIKRGLPLPPRLAGGVGGLSRMSGRPPRYALTRRYQD